MAEIRRMCKAEVQDEVGRLAEVTDAVKQAGVNILALCAWAMEGKGHLLMVSSEPDRCCEALSGCVDKCEWEDAVCVTVANQVGTLNTVAKKLGDAGIQINLAFATCGAADQAMVVLCTNDNAKAIEVL